MYSFSLLLLMFIAMLAHYLDMFEFERRQEEEARFH